MKIYLNYSVIIIIIVLWSVCDSSESLRILGIFPLSVRSHFAAGESLMKNLAKKGHQVDVYSHFPQKKRMPNYVDFSLAGSMIEYSNNLTYEESIQYTNFPLSDTFAVFCEPTCNLLKLPVFQNLIHSPPKDPPYDLVVVEQYAHYCHLIWKHWLNIPLIALNAVPIFDWFNEPLGNPFISSVTPITWSGYFHPMSFWERTMNTIQYHIRNLEHDYYLITSQEKIINKYFGSNLPAVNQLRKDIDLLLVNSHHSLDGIRPFTPNIIEVGGIHIYDDGTKLPPVVQTWLDESKDGFIYVSFGSMTRIETFPNEVVNAFYSAFKNIAPIRVLMKIAKPEDLLPGLPENVLTHNWLPQIQVLSHQNIRGFITHGGLMSTQESIYYGVPMIGIPILHDQFTNVNSYVRKGIAIRIDHQGMTDKALTESINQILHDEKYKNNILKLSKTFSDRPMSPIDTAVFWVEYIARHGPGALKPPIVDLTWWQAHLIDVYGFLILVAVIVYILIKLTLKRMCFLVGIRGNQQLMQKKHQ